MATYNLCFAVIAASVIVGVVAASAIWLPHSFFANSVDGCTKESAKEALSLMKDWTVWMASIQTGTIAAVGFIAKDGLGTLKVLPHQRDLAILVVLLNTFALFFSAWLLTSLSSLMLRVQRAGLRSYDFYNFPLYAYMEKVPWLRDKLTVGFFAFWNHWLWGLGILSFGALSVSMALKPP